MTLKADRAVDMMMIGTEIVIMTQTHARTVYRATEIMVWSIIVDYVRSAGPSQ